MLKLPRGYLSAAPHLHQVSIWAIWSPVIRSPLHPKGLTFVTDLLLKVSYILPERREEEKVRYKIIASIGIHQVLRLNQAYIKISFFNST